MTYEQWIAEYVKAHNGHVRGICYSATREMMKAFPELRHVRGHVNVVSPRTEHWWLETPDGRIVDPTAAQFERIERYIEHDGPDPVGKCMNCGGYVWTPVYGRSACSKTCADELESDYA